jgi:hypothetical protein
LGRLSELAIQFDIQKFDWCFQVMFWPYYRLLALRARQHDKSKLRRSQKRRRNHRQNDAKQPTSFSPNADLTPLRNSQLNSQSNSQHQSNHIAEHLSPASEPQFVPHFPGEQYEEYLANKAEEVLSFLMLQYLNHNIFLERSCAAIIFASHVGSWFDEDVLQLLLAQASDSLRSFGACGEANV